MNDIKTIDMPVLRLRKFGVAFGEKVILANINLDIPERGIVVLLGPGGTGKSTLLRSIAGLNDANPTFETWGDSEFCGQSLADDNRPTVVSQNARLMMATVLENVVHNLPERNNLNIVQQKDLATRLLKTADLEHLCDRLNESVINLGLAEQRRLAILRLAAAGTRLICLDEPTSGLTDDEAYTLLSYVKKISEKRAVLIVLHNLKQAASLGGNTALLAGGCIQEVQSTSGFIQNPRTVPAQQWVKSGSCHVPMPGTPIEDLADDVEPPPPVPDIVRLAPSESYGPRGFLWLKPGQLAGTPLPGVFHDIEYDMQMLKKVGVTTLITLTTKSLDEHILEKFDVTAFWEAIPDMKAPDVDQAVRICKTIENEIMEGRVVAVHCRAGMGRTGTVLACYLIWKGDDAIDALEKVRGVEPRWVQSMEQVEFLQMFEDHLVAENRNVDCGFK